MMCLLCRQAKTVDAFTLVKFERGEMRVVVNNVPAQICPNCGEAYVDERVAVQLLQDADEVLRAGILESAIDYDVP